MTLYSDWLNLPTRARALRVDIKYYDINAAQIKTLTVGTHPMVHGDLVIEQRIAGGPELRLNKDAGFDVTGVKLMNADGKFNKFFDEWSVEGRNITIKLGDPSWQEADFQLEFEGRSESIRESTNSTIEILVRDKSKILSEPISDEDFTAPGTTDDKIPMPYIFGWVFNAAPVEFNDSEDLPAYKITGSQMDSVVFAWERGLEMTPGVDFVPDNTNGEIDLAVRPTGDFTVEVQGEKTHPAGPFARKPAELVEGLARKDVLVAADINAASFTAMNAAMPMTCGIAVDASTNLKAAIDEVFSPLLIYYYFDVNGELTLWQIIKPTAAFDYDITLVNLVGDSVRLVSRIKPAQNVLILYRKNYNVMAANEIADHVTMEFRREFRKEFRKQKRTTVNLRTTYRDAHKSLSVETVIFDETDAGTEADRQKALYDVPINVWEVTCTMQLMPIKLGDMVRFTESGGKIPAASIGQCVAIIKRPTLNRITLTVWVWQAP